MMLPFDPGAEQLTALLGLEGLAGCMVNGSLRQAHEADERIGRFDGKRAWRFPATRAKTLVFPGQRQEVRPRLLFEAMQYGVRHVIVMDAFCTWRCRTIPAWYLAYLYRRLVDRIVLSSFGRHIRFSRVWGSIQAWLLQRGWNERQAESSLRPCRPDALPGSVVQVSDSLAPGGAERQVVYTALGLRNKGKEVAVVCRQGGSEYLDFYRAAIADRVPTYTLPHLADIWFSVGDPGQDACIASLAGRPVRRLLSFLPRHLSDEILALAVFYFRLRPQVVHCWQDHMNIVGGLAAVIAGVPEIVLSTHNMAPFRLAYNQPFLVPAYRFLLGIGNVRMFNNSAAGARDYAAWLGMASSRIHVVRNGFGPLPRLEDIPAAATSRATFDIPAGALVVGGVFRFYEEKRPLLWLEAAAVAAGSLPELYFLIAGDGPMRREMEKRAEQLGIARNLRMPGQIANINVALSAMDVLMLSSRLEGLPNVLIEAQAVGCPVVSTDVGGCAEAMEDGVTGWLVDGTAEALAERVVDVLNDPEWRRTAAKRGPELVASRFSGERMLADTLAVYGDTRVSG